MSGYRITNVQAVDARGVQTGDVYIKDGKIAAPFDGAKQFNGQGKTLLPAMIDMHTHLRDPGLTYKEDMQSGMRAALKGGFGYLCAMANTSPVMATPKMVEDNHKRAQALALCGLTQAAAAGEGLKDEEKTDWAALAKATKMLSNDGMTIFSERFMEELLVASGELGFLVSTHCQPEREIVRRDLALLAKVGGRLHIGHISHRETLCMIKQAKERGLRFSCEVTPHHLIGYDLDYRVNPPIRTKEDTMAMIRGIQDGTIDCLATDHAPHSPEDKQNGMAGISNIEYALPVFIRVFAENGIPLERLAQMGSRRPAELLGLNKGLLQEGYDADLVLVDMDWEGKICPDEMVSRSHNTPFGGYPIKGKVLFTMVEGEIRYAHDGSTQN